MKSSEIILESTFNIGKDVDMLYALLFKDTVRQIHNGTWDGELKDIISLSTANLSSLKARKAHKLNPMLIITTHENEYNPGNNFISIALGKGALQLIKDEGSFEKAIEFLKNMGVPEQVQKFKRDLTPSRVKGSIYHELSHWLDDTFHNNHLRDKISRAPASDGKSLSQGEANVGLTKYEINAQIHSIKQLKRDYAAKWDLLSFQDLINLHTSLMQISQNLSDTDLIRWKRMILSRMAREGLVGNQMQRKRINR